MENLTNQILKLKNGNNYLVLRQASYKGKMYFLTAGVTEDEDFNNEVKYFERVDKEGKFFIKEVTDKATLDVLMKNIKLDNNE